MEGIEITTRPRVRTAADTKYDNYKSVTLESILPRIYRTDSHSARLAVRRLYLGYLKH